MPPPDHLAQNFDDENPDILALGAPMLIRKDKTCPHCRASVKEAPIEAWAVKDIVSAAFSNDGGLAAELFPGHALSPSNRDSGNGDPWQGIFKRDMGRWGWFEDGGGNGAAAAAGGDRRARGFYDEEDDAYRCTECFHEIWDGVCSSCGREYPGHGFRGRDSDDADSFDGDPDFDDDMSEEEWLDNVEGAMEVMLGRYAIHGLNQELEALRRAARDDGYESSFIDDDEPGHEGAHIEEVDPYFDSDEEEDEDEVEVDVREIPRLRRNAPPPRPSRASRRLFTSDEDSASESDEDRPRRPYHRRIEIHSDDDEDDEDDDDDEEGDDDEDNSDSDEGISRVNRLSDFSVRVTRRVLSDSDDDDDEVDEEEVD